MTTGEVGTVSAAVLSVLAIIGLAVRFVLVPYLRDQLIAPLRETHRQLTQHTARADPDTLVDQLESMDGKLTETLRAFRRRSNVTEAKVHALTQALDRHIAWASEEDHRMWTEIRGRDNTKGDHHHEPHT